MSELEQYVVFDLMIEAAKDMGERADDISSRRVAMYSPMVQMSAFGGQGGVVDHPTS